MNNFVRAFWKYICKDISFSIIMPTYNRGYIIEKSIDSVLTQSFTNYELIIVDDGSTDNTRELIFDKYKKYIESKKIVYVEGNHGGVCVARNIGLATASNEWIAYIDSDNTIKPDYLLYFAKNIKIYRKKCFYCGLTYASKKTVLNKKFDYRILLKGNFIDMGTFVHNRSLVMELGGFDENLTRLVDWDLILTYTKKYTPKHIDKILLIYNDNDRNDRITKSENLKTNYEYIRSKHQ